MFQPISELDMATLPGAEVSRDDAGFGAMETARGCLPLVGLDVRAAITGLNCQIVVRQTFCNALDEALEATYIFPLPDRAAVTRFQMRIGDRVIDGQLKERGQARTDYEQAIRDGHRAAIADEERSGTFSLRVGNIPSKEEVQVELTLVGPLPVSAGEATFQFPLVVAPRYVPGSPLDGSSVGAGWASDTDQVPDASRVTPPVLLPGFPNPVRLSLEVTVDPAGLLATTPDWTARIRSSLHSVITDAGPPWTIRLQPGERLNRDFILRFPVSMDAAQASLVCSAAGAEPGTLALTLVPPVGREGARPRPRDVVVVLDRSGSMGGWKMVAARRAVGRMIDTLLDQDRFTVLAFDDHVDYPEHADRKLVDATNRARWQTLEWIGRINARGGTEIVPALQQALSVLAAQPDGRESVLVLVTDGQVAGEDVVLQSLSQAGRAVPRIHTLGIDRAVNAGFLHKLADLGGGTCDLVESEERLDEAMDHIHRAIGSPVLTQIRLEVVGGTWNPESLAPARVPDLFADRPVTLFARHNGDGQNLRVRIRAVDARGQVWEHEVAAQPGPSDTLRSLWGRARVRDLEDRYAAGGSENPQALADEIVAVSLSSHVLCRFTAYVAVDRSEVVNAEGRQQHVVQPVEMPDGWGVGGMGLTSLCAMPLPMPGSRALRARSRPAIMDFAATLHEHADAMMYDTDADDHGPASVTALVKLITDLLDDVERHGAKRQSWYQRRISHLSILLAELIALLRLTCTTDPHSVLLDELRQKIDQCMSEDAGKDTLVQRVERLKALIPRLRLVLADVGMLPGPPPPRDRFWA